MKFHSCLKWLILILTPFLFLSCSDDPASEESSPEPLNPNAVSKEIGSDGGEITSNDGNLTLTFPEGALPGTETITIEELSEDVLGSEFDEIIDALGISGAYKLGPDGLQFDEPVTASIASDQSATLNDSTMQLSIRRLMFISSDGEGELLDSLRIEPAGDGSGNVQLSGELSHFSTFTVTSTDSSGLLTATISGIPEQLQVNRTASVDVSAEVSLLKVDQARYAPLVLAGDVFYQQIVAQNQMFLSQYRIPRINISRVPLFISVSKGDKIHSRLMYT